MMAFQCYLFIVIVAALMLRVSDATSIRSHYYGGRRVKGETSNNQKRHLQEDQQRKTKKHAGNILLTLDQVWTDASSVETKVKIKTTCKKPKKQSKTTDGASVTGNGVGVGKGSGKGGKGGESSGNFNTVTSNNTVTSDTASSSTTSNSTSVTSGTGNTNSTDQYRLLQFNSTNSNVFGNKTSSSTSATTNTTTTTSTVTADNTPNSTFVITVTKSNGGKSGKGKGESKKSPPQVSADGIPYCEEEEEDNVEGEVDSGSGGDGSAVRAPSAPGSSPAISPTTVASPSVLVQSPVVASPTVPSETGVVGQATVCEAYKFGAAPTDAPSQNHTTFITMNVDVGSDITSIYSQIGTVLRQKIGPLLLDCVSQRRFLVQRVQQENATELVNVVFSDPTFTGESCTETGVNTTCVPSMFTSEVYFYGQEPVGFAEKLRQAMLFTDFDILGLQNFADVEVTANVEEGDAEPAPAPAADRATPPTTTTAVETTQRSKNGPSPGVSVAVAVSVLALVLAALFVVRRHREAKSSDSLSKHIEFTDDFPIDAGAETADDNSANSPIPLPQKSYVVSDQSLDESWNTTSRRSAQEGQEVYAGTSSRSRNRNYPQTSFVEADVPDPRLMNLPRRFYESADTVNL